MEINDQFFSLDPVQRAKVLNTALVTTIQGSSNAERFNGLTEDKQQEALAKVRESVSKQYPDLFRIEVAPAIPLKIKTEDGMDIEGDAAKKYRDSSDNKTISNAFQGGDSKSSYEVVQEEKPATFRPLYDEQTEFLIGAIKSGEVKPEDFTESEVEELIPLVRQAAPEKAGDYVRVITDKLSSEGIEPDSFVAKSFIRGLLPSFVEDTADKVFSGVPAFDGTTDAQYERWRRVYGEIDEDFRTIGAVAGVVGTGGVGTSLVNTAMNPGKLRLAAKLVVAGAADAAYTEQLPAFSAEIFDVQNDPARKALTFAEGMLLAGMFDLGTTVAKKLVGKDVSAAKQVLTESGAENIDATISSKVKSIVDEIPEEKAVGSPTEGEATRKDLLPQSRLQKGYQRARVILQDPYKPIRDVQRKSGIKITGDDADPYLAKRLMMPETLAMQSAVQEEFTGVIKKVQSLEKASEIPTGKGYEMVNRYMEALHAPERNAFLGVDGAAGMTTDEANQLRKTIEARPDFGEIKSISEDVQRIHRRTLDFLLEGELITKDTHTALRERWKNHVPLNRIMDELDDDSMIQVMSGGGPGASVQSAGLKVAKGSEREVRPIVANVYDNLLGAIKRSRRNLANLSAYRFYENNKEQLKGLIDVNPAEGIKGDKDLIFFKDGNKMAMTIKDPALSRAFQHVPEGERNAIIRGLLAMNRYLGRIYTGWNPDFPLPNKVRDMGEAAANAIRTAGFKGAAKTLLRAPADMKAIWDYATGKATEGAMRYKAMIDAGGSTGGLSHMTYAGIEETFDLLQKNKARSARGYLKNLDELIDRVNMVFEDSTRLSVFEESLKAGKTPKQAALAARDSSFDPILRGESGNLLSAGYLFFNPAIQSAANMGRTLSNPRRALPIMGTLLGVQYTLDMWNRSIDPEYRSKLSGYERGKSLVFLMPKGEGDGEGFKKLTIPLGYGLLPVKVANDYAIDVMHGESTDSVPEAAVKVTTSILEGYNPFGGAGKAAFMPVPLLAMVSQMMSNEDGLGNDIRPDWLERENISDTEKVFDYTATTHGGQMAIAIAHELEQNGIEVSPENMLFWYRNLTGGPGKTVQNLFELTSDLWHGEVPDPNHIPILRRFFSVTPPDIAQSRAERDDSIQKAEKDYRTERHRRQRKLRKDIKALVEAKTKEEYTQAATGIQQKLSVTPSDSQYAQNRMKQELLDLSQDDRRIQRFGVNDGGRAKLYVEMISRMSPAEAKEFMEEQRQKRLLTEDVWNQMGYLWQQRQRANGNN